jgi:hypothetical protein
MLLDNPYGPGKNLYAGKYITVGNSSRDTATIHAGHAYRTVFTNKLLLSLSLRLQSMPFKKFQEAVQQTIIDDRGDNQNDASPGFDF